jgi:hypothetical protein
MTVTVTRRVTPPQFNVIRIVSYNDTEYLYTAGRLADCPAADATHLLTPVARQAMVVLSPGSILLGVAVRLWITTADCAGT